MCPYLRLNRFFFFLLISLQDGKVEPEVFTERLQHELQSSPQPYLVPFLKVLQYWVLTWLYIVSTTVAELLIGQLEKISAQLHVLHHTVKNLQLCRHGGKAGSGLSRQCYRGSWSNKGLQQQLTQHCCCCKWVWDGGVGGVKLVETKKLTQTGCQSTQKWV